MEDKNSSLGHMPLGDRWSFDDSVTSVFPDMLRRSIPQYEIMRQGVYDIGVTFIQPSTHVVDIGCSRGDSLAPFINTFGAENNYFGVDNSIPMLEVAKKRFRTEIDQGIVRLSYMDLGSECPAVMASLTLCVLTLQFVSPSRRPGLIQEIYDNTLPGGALILVEKVLGSCADIDKLMIDIYHDLKKKNGYTPDEIERKRHSLVGVLVPLTTHHNEKMLHSVGFEKVDCFWRWMNFAGFVAVK